MNTKEKSKRKFNFVDAIILLLILLAVALLAFIFIFKGASFITDLFGGGEESEIYYAVELSLVREELADNITAGQKVTDSGHNTPIGEVVTTYIGDAEYAGADENGIALKGAYPGYKSVIVIIESDAVKGAYNYSIDEYDLQVGSTVRFFTPEYTGGGFCVGLSEVKTDADKAAFIEKIGAQVYRADVPGIEAEE